MDLLEALIDVKAERVFMVVTASGGEAFAEIDQCEEFIAGLDGVEYAVVRLLWRGGVRLPDLD